MPVVASRFQTTSSRDDDFTKASLQLAREVLHRHVKSLKRPIFEFENASCEEWKDFVARKRVSQVLTSSTSQADCSALAYRRLCQRPWRLVRS